MRLERVKMSATDCDQRLQQARAFDRDALAAIYDDYHPLIFRYVARQINDREIARELTAVVFERLLHTIRQGKGPERQLKAWLYSTAHNLVIDHYRRQQHRNHLPLPEQLAGPTANPGQVVEQRLMHEDVLAALGELTPEQHQVITLKFLEGLSNAEVAAIMDKPIGAVKSLQHRGLAALQRLLTQPMAEGIEA